MDLWRQAVDMEIPINEKQRLQLFSQRGEMIGNFVRTSSGWLMLLRGCKATDADHAELDELKIDVQAFKEWAQADLDELALRGNPENMPQR